MVSHFFGSVLGGLLVVGGWLGFAHQLATPQSAPQEVQQVAPLSRGPNTAPQTSVSSGVQQEGVGAANTNTPEPSTGTASADAASAYGHAYTQEELLAMAGPVDFTKLPLGDGKYSTSGAKKGYVYVCHVQSGGAGAQVNGPWIHGTTWDETSKIAVQGNVSWPNATISVTVNGGTRTIVANDEPTDHATGIFPVQASDPAAQYDRNPSSITPQHTDASLPADPAALSKPDCIYGAVGILTDGVTLDDAFDALYRDAPAHEEQDSCQGHPNNEQGYHDHSLSLCFKDVNETQVIGWAFDGFPITGPQVASGKYLSTDDLDECHGLTSTITIDGKEVTTYHYVMTYDFPYSVGCFRAKSYEPKPGGANAGQNQAQASMQQGAGVGGQGSGTPPQAAISACSGKASGAVCAVSTPQGSLNGVCRTPPQQSSLACIPS
jgi:hypothetical protein